MIEEREGRERERGNFGLQRRENARERERERKGGLEDYIGVCLLCF